MHPWCIIAGVFIGLLVAWSTFHWFFRDSGDYFESWKFRFKPDLFSLFDGELWEDWKATVKLNLYHLLALLAGIGAYFLLHSALCP
jgi:hypothetical protein